MEEDQSIRNVDLIENVDEKRKKYSKYFKEYTGLLPTDILSMHQDGIEFKPDTESSTVDTIDNEYI